MKILIGKSKSIQRVRENVRVVALSTSHVVITGEPGTGKSVVAQSIHEQSSDKDKPFAILDVAGIDEIKLRTTVQSILTRREFLNPSTSGHGNFHLPDGAALILDGLDRSSIPAQTILREFIDGIIETGQRMRLILLVNGGLKELVRSGQLLSDFLKITKKWAAIQTPPLRERVEDIPELIEHFVLETAKEMDLGEIAIDVNAISVLVRKEWKGNVQELKSFVERAMLLSNDKEVFMLPEGLIDEQSELTQMLERINTGVDFAIDKSMELIEKKILERVLTKFGFNQSRAARFLKITEDTLRYRMKKLGIQNTQ
ncbi:MAG: sigma 54-interacting transcriptional regulator [Bacteroidota bacterium]